MTDKIMIDGVDVSECLYYNNGCDGHILCMGGDDCYYKQLKRKEKECDKYKLTLEEIKGIATNYCNACKEFECELTNCMYCNYNKILQKCEVLND